MLAGRPLLAVVKVNYKHTLTHAGLPAMLLGEPGLARDALTLRLRAPSHHVVLRQEEEKQQRLVKERLICLLLLL